MAKFVSKKHLSLEFLGEEWKECFIKFTSMSVKEVRELAALKLDTKSDLEVADITCELLKDHFIEGLGYDDDKKELVKLVKEDLDSFPSEFTQEASLFLIAGKI